MTCFCCDLLAHESRAVAAPERSKNSILIAYRRPATSAIVPVFCVAEWTVQLSIRSRPPSQRRIPSSEIVEIVYVSECRGSSSPVQRAEKSSARSEGAGAPWPQEKSIFGSTRETDAPDWST